MISQENKQAAFLDSEEITFQQLQFVTGLQQQLFGLVLQRLSPLLSVGHTPRFLIYQLFHCAVLLLHLRLKLLKHAQGHQNSRGRITEKTKLSDGGAHLFDLLCDPSDVCSFLIGQLGSLSNVCGFVGEQLHILLEPLQPLGGVVQL